MTIKRAIRGAVCLAVMLPAQSVLAQEGGVVAIEEILVTATRRAESIQDVPVAVTVLDQSALEDGGIVDIRDIGSLTPSVNLFTSNSSTTTTSVRIRGVGTLGNNIGLESAVGTFIDSVYQPRPGIALGEFVDVKQVEVLRGPQGTLFGRNTSAGALVVQSNAPVIGENSGNVELTAGNESLVNVKGVANLPANDELAFRFAGSYRSRDGLYDNPQTGEDSHAIDHRFMLRGQALWQPSEDINVRVITDYAESDENCCQAILEVDTAIVPLFALAGIPGGGVAAVGDSALEKRLFNGNSRFEESEHFGISAEIEWEIGNSTLTVIPAYRDFRSSAFGDADGVSLNVLTFAESSPTVTDVESFTLEARLQGEAADGKLSWLIGAFYGDEDLSYDQTLMLGPDADAYFNATYFAVLAAGGNPFALGPNPTLVFTQGNSNNGSFNRSVGTQNTESVSIFTHNIFHVTDRFSITGGLRYVDEEKVGGIALPGGQSDACQGALTNPAFAPGGPLQPLAPLGIGLACVSFYAPQFARSFDAEFADDAFTYLFSGGYELTDNILVYASYNRGFKSGGINLDIGADPNGPTFESEEVETIEIGWKSTFFDDRLGLNIALFDQDIDDFQLNTFDGLAFQVFNVPAADSTGVEIEFRADLADWFTVNTGLAIIDSSYPDDCAGNLMSPTVSMLCGTDLPNAPDVAAAIGAVTHFVLGNGIGLRLLANVRYDDKSLPSPVNPTAYQDSNTTVDVRAVIVAANERWSVDFWGKNVTDEVVLTRGKFPLAFRGFNDASTTFVTDPKTYGVTVRVGF